MYEHENESTAYRRAEMSRLSVMDDSMTPLDDDGEAAGWRRLADGPQGQQAVSNSYASDAPRIGVNIG